MKKIILLVVLVLTMLVAVSLTACSFKFAKADELKQEITQVEKQLNDEEEKTEIEKLKEKVAELTNKLNEALSNANSYFTTTVLPLIISCGGGLLTGLAVLIPTIKKNAKYKALLTAYNKSNEELTELQKLLETTDITKIKDGLSSLFSESLVNAVSTLKLDSETISKIIAKIDTATAKIDSIISAAQSKDVWGNSDEAVSLLNSSATQSELEKANEEILQLKAELGVKENEAE